MLLPRVETTVRHRICTRVLRRCAILKAMGLQYDDLPGWEFTIVEQSAGVYRLTAVRDGGITGGGTDTDPDALLDEYKRWAHKVEVDLAQRRRNA